MEERWPERETIAGWSTKFVLRPLLTVGVLCALFVSGVHANPSGGTVVAGTGSFSASDNTLNVTQSSPRLSINWQSFSIGARERVNFLQPDAYSVAINRVLGNNASRIYGSLSANGQVFLINPNGVLFAPGAQVNVGGLLASTLEISDDGNIVGRYIFNGTGGSVVNQGQITAADGGYVALLGSKVSNEGVIIARQGTVALGAGSAATLDLSGDGLVNLAVDQAAVKARVTNSNLIQADGGRVLMTARTAEALAGTVVNNTGIVQAKSINNEGGVIRLDGGTNGTVMNSGTLDASAMNAGERGGVIAVEGEKINASGECAFDVSGTPGGTLTLSSYGDLKINRALSAGTNANIVLRADNSGTGIGTVLFSGPGMVALNGTGMARIYYNPVSYALPTEYAPYVEGGRWMGFMLVNNVNQLQAINTNLSGIYALGRDINASATATWNGGAGFMPIGNAAIGSFSGILEGNSHIIDGLTIYRPLENNIGLFGVTDRAMLGDVKLTNVDIKGYNSVGGIVGLSTNMTFVGLSSTSGSVSGHRDVGGLVGVSEHSYVMSSSSSSEVGATSSVGGLVGLNNINSIISESSASGKIAGDANVGGLVGMNANSSNIINSVNAASVSGGYAIGGLAGINYSGSSISGSTNTGVVSGDRHVGGLVGDNFSAISSSRNMGAVSGSDTSDDVGGLVGYNNLGSIANSTNQGRVKGGFATGGLVGYNSNAGISYSHNQGEVSGTNNVGGLVGVNTGGAAISYSTSSGDVSGGTAVGGLVGQNSGLSMIDYAASSGNVSGQYGVGGLVGGNIGSGTYIRNSISRGNVNGLDYVGGLAGANYDMAAIANSASSSSVSGQNYVGGLVGWNTGQSAVVYSNSSGSVAGQDYVGGLVGFNSNSGNVSRSFSTGAVSGRTAVGGLAGVNDSYAVIDNAYSTGSVTSNYSAGGLVGVNYNAAIYNCYSTGFVQGGSYAGGLIGASAGGTVTSSYWDMYSSGQLVSAGGMGLTTPQMQNKDYYAGWDFVYTWNIFSSSYPFLRGASSWPIP